MPDSNVYLRSQRIEGVTDAGSKVKYPISPAAHMILLSCYREQNVIPKAVIELLRDYNPFSSRTGLTKKQVTKYLRILLDEQPELADNIVAGLPDAKDLLPPHLLARIPPPGNPDIVDIPVSSLLATSKVSSAIKSTGITTSRPLLSSPQLVSSGPVAKSVAKRGQPPPPSKIYHQQNAPEDLSITSKSSATSIISKSLEMCREFSAPKPENLKILFPVKPLLIARPKILKRTRSSIDRHSTPPLLTPANRSLQRFPSSPSLPKCPKVSLLRKSISVENIQMVSDWSVASSVDCTANSSDLLNMISQSDTHDEDLVSPASLETLSTIFSEDADIRQAALMSPTNQSAGINQHNFNNLLPALASAIDDSNDVSSPLSAKDYDPLLAAASDKVLRVKPSRKITSCSFACEMSDGQPPAAPDFSPPPPGRHPLPDNRLLPDNLLVSYLNRSLTALEEGRKNKKQAVPELIIPAFYSGISNNMSDSSGSPTITYKNAGSTTTDLLSFLSPTRVMPTSPVQYGSIAATPTKFVYHKPPTRPPHPPHPPPSCVLTACTKPSSLAQARPSTGSDFFLRQALQNDSSIELNSIMSPDPSTTIASGRAGASSSEWSPLSR